MELSLLIFLSSFLLFLLTSWRFQRPKSSPQHPKLPPGPWKLPIIGSMHHLLGRSTPHRLLAGMAKKHGPIMHLQLGEVPAVVVSSAMAAKEILQTHDASFASRPKVVAADVLSYRGSNIAFAPYGKHWRRMKKLLVVDLLSAKRVQSFRSMWEEETRTLMFFVSEAAAKGEVVNVSERLTSLTLNMVSRAAFGGRFKEQRRFLVLLEAAVALSGAFSVADYFPSSAVVRLVSGAETRIRRCHRELDEILQEILVEHKEEMTRKGDHRIPTSYGEDLVDVLLRAQEEDMTLTDDILKAAILDVFIAGTGSSATVMEWALSELMKNPNVRKKAQEEVRQVFQDKAELTISDVGGLAYLKQVIKETMRLHPPAPLLVPRECIQTCEVLGYEVPKNTRVFVNVWAIGRDSNSWEEPETFKPERFEDGTIDFKGHDFEFLPFGGGRRMCPGILFGMESMELPLAQLLYYFDWELPHGMVPGELDMTEASGLSMPRRSSLRLCPVPCRPLHVV